ncbi:MFS transporter, partial [Pseudohyphozyma bogoriensis]
KLALCFTGMLLSVFLIALDQTILSPALPVIASKFEALTQIAWISSAYFLTQTAFLLLYGQILTCFDRKWTFLLSISLFEIGSLICGVAPNVDVLIFGRAFAGCGAAGIFVSCLSIIADVTRLEDRPKLLGLFGGVFAVSSVIGPLLGGAFTDKVSWRWCFYINLPFGAVTVLAVFFILPSSPPPPIAEEILEYTDGKWRRWTFGKFMPARGTFIYRLGILDWWGATLMLATITLLLLPLQWGGNEYPEVIGLFCGFAAMVIIFAIYEWKFAGVTSILPLRFFKNRTQVGACLEAFMLMFIMLEGIYYLPIFYQATRGVSATRSGIDILGFMLSIVVAAGVSGALVSATGRYWHFLVCGPFLICIGAGLLYTITEFDSSAKLTGFQIIIGAGLGTVMQNTIIAVQADLEDEKDVPQATALVTFTQLVGGTIGLSIASTIFSNKLHSALLEYAPNAPIEIVRNSVDAVKTLPADQKPGVIHAYVLALNLVFVIGVAAGGFASLSGLLIRNLSVKGKDLMAGAA